MKSSIDYHIKYRSENKLKIIEYLGGECAHCGLKSPYPEIYDVHHLNPENKKTIDFSDRRLENIKDELDDCVLLCANCHRIISLKNREDKK